MTLIYPGSFDPVTLGHIDIAQRGASMANKLVVAVLTNASKTPHFTLNQRIAFLEDALGHIPNIEIDTFGGLLVDYARLKNATAIIRGIRGATDFENEAMYATHNKLLSGQSKLETIFIPATPSLSYISSTIAREAAHHIQANSLQNIALENLVTPMVKAALLNTDQINNINKGE